MTAALQVAVTRIGKPAVTAIIRDLATETSEQDGRRKYSPKNTKQRERTHVRNFYSTLRKTEMSVRNNNQLRKPRTSLRPTDKKTIDGITSSVVATQEKNSRCTLLATTGTDKNTIY
jgi:hypothetical protein